MAANPAEASSYGSEGRAEIRDDEDFLDLPVESSESIETRAPKLRDQPQRMRSNGSRRSDQDQERD